MQDLFSQQRETATLNQNQMYPLVVGESQIAQSPIKKINHKRIESIDLLRGAVIVIMAIDHVRDYFHNAAFLYSPEDLSRTNTILFFTRWITHYCAPVFVFLAGTAAFLYGSKRTRKELATFLFTRGIWLVFAELFILSLIRTFNPSFHFFNLQVIWSTGICMIALSGMIYMNRALILLTGILLIGAHNLLDNVHVSGGGIQSFLWALVHESGYFSFGQITFHVHYPLIPWIGVMAVGYCFGSLYHFAYNPERRKKTLLVIGSAAIVLFIILRSGNFYGDSAHWSSQQNATFTILSFLNVSKYPPSLLYILMTLGPPLIFLAWSEKPLNKITNRLVVFGRVPMFFYLAHLLLIHFFATIGAVFTGYKWSDMVLDTMVNRSPNLKGYGFNLITVYLVWILLIVLLYPICKWFADYKRSHQSRYSWLSYL
jgi:uncharacterized membrane protein